MYAEYTQPQLTFLALNPGVKGWMHMGPVVNLNRSSINGGSLEIARSTSIFFLFSILFQVEPRTPHVPVYKQNISRTNSYNKYSGNYGVNKVRDIPNILLMM